jgi:hypothetical protein
MQLPTLSLDKEGHGVVKLVTFGHRSASSNWRPITRDPMDRSVRPTATDQNVVSQVSAAKVVNKAVLVMAVLIPGTSPVAATAQGGGADGWAAGLLVEYASVGGYQLADVRDGVGVSLFVNRRMSSTLTLAVGLSASFHQIPALILEGYSGSGTSTEVFGTVYVRPTLHLLSDPAAVIPYVAVQVGLMGGNFTNTSYGLQGGGSCGVLFSINRRLDLDIGMMAGLVYVGPFQHGLAATTSKWGRTLVLRSGMVIRLG